MITNFKKYIMHIQMKIIKYLTFNYRVYFSILLRKNSSFKKNKKLKKLKIAIINLTSKLLIKILREKQMKKWRN